ncbi:MAG TPA: efflux RND transporter periplasmic adaptor subunit [Granulicella sp.]
MQRRIVTGLAGAVCFLTACRSTTPTDAGAAVVTVPTAVVTRAGLSNELTLSAEFTPYQDVDVMAKVAGYVKNIRVDIGDHVREGEVLATLEVPELEDEMAKANAALEAAQSDISSAKSDLQRAKAAYDIAHLSFTRISDVSKREAGLVPMQEIDVAHSHELEAEAQMATAQSTLQSAEQRASQAKSEQSRARAMLDYATIRAPFTGVITKRYANTGSMIQAGISSQTQSMPVVRLAQNNLLRLILPVPVTAAANVRVGLPVDVHVVTLNRSFPGKVARFADSLQMDTRTMATEIDVPNPKGELLPGMYAEVQLHLADHANALSAPLDAIEGVGTGTQHAYIVRAGLVHIVPVTTGIQTDSKIEILSGAQEGDALITGRHTGLTEGQQVEAQPAAYEQTDTKPTNKAS